MNTLHSFQKALRLDGFAPYSINMPASMQPLVTEESRFHLNSPKKVKLPHSREEALSMLAGESSDESDTEVFVANKKESKTNSAMMALLDSRQKPLIVPPLSNLNRISAHKSK